MYGVFCLQEVGDLHLTQEKAQATIRDLRMCLEEVRQERSQLFEEVRFILMFFYIYI